MVLLAVAAWLGSCDDTINPTPPKQTNQPPETFLYVESDSLAPQLYRLKLSWLGSDADGRVVAYRRRWTCPPGTVGCPLDTTWSETQALSEVFVLPVPDGEARYVFSVASVDDEGAPDAAPATQTFDLLNNSPVVEFEAGTLPQQSLPAITFYFVAADSDTTPKDDDRDSPGYLSHFLVWLDGDESSPTVVPSADGAVTLREEDFGDRYGPRTIFAQVVDEGGAASPAIQHTWEVQSAPQDGILLVDDCRMGGNLERVSDNSWRNVLNRTATERTRILDIEALPRVNRNDLDATLELFDRTIWYTDADTTSSGALQLASSALLALIDRNGKLVISSGLVFGTRSAFGELEPLFRQRFGIETVFGAPAGGTNFALSLQDTIQAAVHPGLTSFRMRSLGLRPIMDCFRSVASTATRFLYFYPESTLVRGGFSNPERFDIGVANVVAGGGQTAYVSFPLGLPMNTNTGENETEIEEVLKLVEILP